MTRGRQTCRLPVPRTRGDEPRARSAPSAGSLAAIWETLAEEALTRARELMEVGFFEERGEGSNPVFWVPFLYRDALKMVQIGRVFRKSSDC